MKTFFKNWFSFRLAFITILKTPWHQNERFVAFSGLALRLTNNRYSSSLFYLVYLSKVQVYFM